jgi:hypothetical protein
VKRVIDEGGRGNKENGREQGGGTRGLRNKSITNILENTWDFSG